MKRHSCHLQCLIPITEDFQETKTYGLFVCWFWIPILSSLFWRASLIEGNGLWDCWNQLKINEKGGRSVQVPVGVGEAFSSATRVCGWHWWTSRKRIALIEKVKSTWERHWGSFSWRGPIRDTVGWSRWTGGPRNLGCILWQLIVDLCWALEGKDDELFPPLRAVCSSLDPGGPLGLPRRDLMEYTELRKQYWTIQRIRQRPSIVRMVD